MRFHESSAAPNFPLQTTRARPRSNPRQQATFWSASRPPSRRSNRRRPEESFHSGSGSKEDRLRSTHNPKIGPDIHIIGRGMSNIPGSLRPPKAAGEGALPLHSRQAVFTLREASLLRRRLRVRSVDRSGEVDRPSPKWSHAQRHRDSFSAERPAPFGEGVRRRSCRINCCLHDLIWRLGQNKGELGIA